MSKSIRFIGYALFAWVGVRAVSLGLVPGASHLAFDVEAARSDRWVPPIEPTPLPSLDPPQGIVPAQTAPAYANPGYAAFIPYPVPVQPQSGQDRNGRAQVAYLSMPPTEQREIHFHGTGNISRPEASANVVAHAVRQPSMPPASSTSAVTSIDRFSLSSWAMMRNEPGSDSLAGRGLLGGSEAGARAIWRFSPKLSASLRTSAPINSQRGFEAGLGLRYQPFARWPAVTLERRQAFGEYGRNAFALFAEGGLYEQPMPWRFQLDGYFQGGVVGFTDPRWFVDGQVAATRPLWGNIGIGAGVWGGAQPGIARLDAGPRASLRLGSRMRVHADYRLNLAGNAEPGSGTVLTLAGEF